jgi:hypothetical protein
MKTEFRTLILEHSNGITKMLGNMYGAKQYEKQFFITDEKEFYKTFKESTKLIEGKFISIKRSGKLVKLKILKKGIEEIVS